MRLSLALLSVVVLALPRAAVASQEPVEGVQLAAAGPRFLARDENVGKGAEPRWRDVSNANVFRRRISLELEAVPLGRALETIARKSGLRLTYSAAVVDLKAEVTIAAADLTVGAALSAVLYDAGVDVLLTSAGQAALIRRVKLEAAVGSMAGRVTDKNGGSPLVGATVIVGGTSRSATTGQDGWYRIADVQIGTYAVRVRYIGYAPATASVTVSAGQETTADFALEKSAQRLEEVVTTGTVVPTEVKALPTPITVITESDIALRHPATVREIFRESVPGAVSWVRPSSPQQTDFSVRGSSTLVPGSGQMKVLVDGIETAKTSASAVDPSSIERIEVIRGPEAAAIYGSDAIGGVVQIFTKRGESGLTRPSIDAEATVGAIQTPYEGYGSTARQSYRLTVSGGSADASYTIGGSYLRNGDYVPRGAQSSPSAFGAMHVARGVVSLDLSARLYVQNSPGASSPELQQAGVSILSKPFPGVDEYQNQSVGALLTVEPVPGWRHRLTLGVDRESEDHRQTEPRLITPADTLLLIDNLASTKTSIAYNTSFETRLAPGVTASLTAGFDHWRLPVTEWSTSGALRTSGSILVAPGQTIGASRNVTNNTGEFAQAQVGIRDALFLTAGIRAEQNTGFGDSLSTPLSPRVGASYVMGVGSGATLKLRTSYGRAIRPPSPTAKLGSLTPLLAIVLPNPTLGPERQQGGDVGFDLSLGGHGSLSVTYYNQTAVNLIQQVTLPSDTIPTNQFQNVGRIRNTGIEIEGAFETGPVTLRGQYAYTRARVARLAPGYTGELLVGDQTETTPRHTAGASLTLTPISGTTIGVSGAYVGSWRNFDLLGYFQCLGGTGPCRNDTFALDRSYVMDYPSFVKLNLNLVQRLGPSFSAVASVDNLTNNTTPESGNISPVVGRITTVGLRMHW
jgi:outer membrane receptor protein involved in Fe transport